ncbi:MAG: hypothetical protein WAV27_03220 [Xanthobacteraceae bacterium]
MKIRANELHVVVVESSALTSSLRSGTTDEKWVEFEHAFINGEIDRCDQWHHATAERRAFRWFIVVRLIFKVGHDGAAIISCAVAQWLVYDRSEDTPHFAGFALTIAGNALVFDVGFQQGNIGGGFGSDEFGPLIFNRTFADLAVVGIIEGLELASRRKWRAG